MPPVRWRQVFTTCISSAMSPTAVCVDSDAPQSAQSTPPQPRQPSSTVPVYGWEERKTKKSWGGISVDHRKLAEAQVRAMTTSDLNRFLVTCAIVPDLYCPSYSSAETLSKEANLMKAAARYKVDASKVTARATVELSRKRKSANGNKGTEGKTGLSK
jgi:hypothetical protein